MPAAAAVPVFERLTMLGREYPIERYADCVVIHGETGDVHLYRDGSTEFSDGVPAQYRNRIERAARVALDQADA